MTEQQACTLCGADGHRAFECPMRLEEHPPVLVPWSVLDRAVMWVEDRRRYGDKGTIVDDWMALKAIQRAALEQPSPVQNCKHPDCGRFYDHNAQRWACRTWAEGVCAADQQPSPAPELERPEVVGDLYLGGWADQDELEDNEIELDMKVVERLQAELASKGNGVHMSLMTVAQHDRIVGALRARNEWLEQVAVEAVETEKQALGLRDAAQARVAELEQSQGAEVFLTLTGEITHLKARLEELGNQEPVAIVDAGDDGYWAEILPDRTVKVGQELFAYPVAQAGQAGQVPDECPHLILFDDADVKPIMFAGSGARRAALAKWEQVSINWNAHLFVRIEKNCRDDRYPCATFAAAPAQGGE